MTAVVDNIGRSQTESLTFEFDPRHAPEKGVASDHPTRRFLWFRQTCRNQAA
jgi:hypothetical protein